MNLNRLRTAYTSLMIAEINIRKDWLSMEEKEFRAAAAELIIEEEKCQELDPREPIQMSLLDLLEKEEKK